MFSTFRGKEKEELEKLQTDFNKFRSTFDRGISVQTLVTTENIGSRFKDFERLLMELGTFTQVVFEQF